MKRALLIAVLLTAGARAADAQVLLDAGVVLVGGTGAGSTAASYIATGGADVPQFTIDRSLATAVGANAHLTIRISKRVGLEVTSRWVRQAFQTKLGGDSDGADDATASQSVDRFVLGGGASVQLKQLGRWHTFARANAGWLRELSDDQTLYQDGWVAEIGGGANFQWKDKPGHFRPYGIRADVWLDVRNGGLSFTDRPRLYSPALAAAIIFKL